MEGEVRSLARIKVMCVKCPGSAPPAPYSSHNPGRHGSLVLSSEATTFWGAEMVLLICQEHLMVI